MPASRLPELDRHATEIAAPPEDVWEALVATLLGTFGRRPATAFAHLVGCTDTAVSRPSSPGDGSPGATATAAPPLAVGSTLPGFHVTAAEPAARLVLEGRHRFSDYALVFMLEPIPSGTRLTAESRATFPGIHGRLYRTALLRTGGHVFGVRRLLDGVRRRAEQPAGAGRSGA